MEIVSSASAPELELEQSKMSLFKNYASAGSSYLLQYFSILQTRIMLCNVFE